MKPIEVLSIPAQIEEEKPPRIEPRLRARPEIRQLLWCDFPKDAQLPEFWKTRPVLVISYRNTMKGAVTVLPCSSQTQDENEWAIRLKTTIDGERSWVICDKPTTVAVSRLSPGKGNIARLPIGEFNPILALMLEWLPKLPH